MVAVAEVMVFAAITLAAASVVLPLTAMVVTVTARAVWRGGFRGYGGRDVWGHWGAYYGPKI